MDIYVPLDGVKLTTNERMEALSSFMFITETRDGRVKTRKCAVGSKQWKFEGYNKDDGILPTVSTDRVIMTSIIEVNDEHDIATMDLSGAFLHAKMMSTL